MCGIIFTNKNIKDLSYINFYNQKRGPDKTNLINYNNYSFIHNLLHITGELTYQPFINDNIYCIFNGEIYNYDKEKYSSDGMCIIDFYKKYGDNFPSYLDGEFAICLVDFNCNKLIVSTDIFSTKPLFISIEKDNIGVSTYSSSLERLEFKDIIKIDANTTMVYELSSLKLTNKSSVYSFDLNQHKDNLDDVFTALENSILKRCDKVGKKIFLGLSSGYDSGCINCVLNKFNIPHSVYSIEGCEDIPTLKLRHEKHPFDKNYIVNTKDSFKVFSKELKENCEQYKYNFTKPGHKSWYTTTDPASSGLAQICSFAKKNNQHIYISGQGPDEIMSDYSNNGKSFFSNSTHTDFNGIFPEDLNTIFPWRNFFGNVQTDYLMKEETVSGCYGIEGRYPYLDKMLVQEFLWLKSDLKNASYKHVLAEYMKQHNYPIFYDKKYGFRANWDKETKKIFR